MELDITAYTKIHPVECSTPDCGDHASVFNYPEYVDRATPLSYGVCYATDMPTIAFRAGSYSGYNEWREILAEMAQGRTPEQIWEDPTGPFSLLIAFPDNEGSIGPRDAAILAAEFVAFEERAAATEDAAFLRVYRNFKRAFEIAADGGMVDFH